jgi:hypothetical protein
MQHTHEIANAIGRPLFHSHASNPRTNAQENLSGITHYVDTSTLRWHKSRILHSRPMFNGVCFMVLESVALDPHYSPRGFRVVVFDLTGRVIYRPDLKQCRSTSRAAVKDFDLWMKSFDPVQHYVKALNERMRQLQSEIDVLAIVAEQLGANTEEK